MNILNFSIPSSALFFCLSLLAVNGERKLSKNDCQCGAFLEKNGTLVFPWVIFVHLKVSPSEIVTCKGTIIASNVVLTSRKCLTKGGNVADAADITVTMDPKGQGTSLQVVEILQKERCSKAMGIQVDFDFTINNTPYKPVCLPDQNELPGDSLVGRQVRYESSRSGILSYLEVKRGSDCDIGGEFKLGAKEDIYCVTVEDTKAVLEEGQPLYMEVKKNPLSTYGGLYGYYFYMVGVSTFVRQESDGRRHLFFVPANTILKTIQSIASTPSSTTWCHQPWEWLKAPEKLKRDESLDCECGLLMEGLAGRIVGGEEATPYEFPWIVKLVIDKENNGTLGHHGLCGASIINDRVILTAAHCVITDERQLNASFGYNVLSPRQTYHMFINSHLLSIEKDPEPVRVSGRVAILHPGYVDSARRTVNASIFNPSLETDVALLILDQPLNFSALRPDGQPLHRPVCLPKYGKPIPVENKTATIAGWGKISPDLLNTSFGEVLQKLEITILPLKECNDKFANFSIGDLTLAYFHRTVVCVGLDLYKNANRGDSGGPLILETSKGKYNLVGATSFLEGYADEKLQKILGFAIYYADLQDNNILPWIDYYSNLHKAKYCKK